MLDFNAWLTAKGFDPASLTESQKTALQAAWRAEQNPAPAPQPAPSSGDTTYEAKVKAAEQEGERQDAIRTLTLAEIEKHKGQPERIKELRSLCEAACADTSCTQQAFQLSLLRTGRFAGPLVYSTSKPKVDNETVEAAVCMSHGLPNIDKKFSEQTLESAHKQFSRGLTLRKLMMLGAQANGYRGDDSDYVAVMKAALRSDGFEMMSSGGPSTGIQVPGILGNTANKFLAASFMNVDQSWRGIAKIRPVNDFKQITTYRMGGSNTFLRVAPSGEIKHGALSETSYTNQAKTFGRLLGISREDYINDDLGAFVTVTQELGRGAADALNNIFWATFLDDSTFFPTDKSKLNYDDGATDSVLSLVGLDNAESIFAVQTKPDGTPLGATPKILLVPAALKNTAMALMTSAPLVVGTTPASGPGVNVFAGRYTVVASPYLHRTSLNDENGVSQTVTGSSTAWYLLADPMDIPVIEVVFLNGRDTPTVETDQFEFDRLGLATRAYFDFGVTKQEYRGGVKLKGAA